MHSKPKPTPAEILRAPHGQYKIWQMSIGQNTLSVLIKIANLPTAMYAVGDFGLELAAPIDRLAAEEAIKKTLSWARSSTANAELSRVGSDMGYLQDFIDGLLQGLSVSEMEWFTWSIGADHDREMEEECAWADRYSDEYWGQCAR